MLAGALGQAWADEWGVDTVSTAPTGWKDGAPGWLRATGLSPISYSIETGSNLIQGLFVSALDKETVYEVFDWKRGERRIRYRWEVIVSKKDFDPIRSSGLSLGLKHIGASATVPWLHSAPVTNPAQGRNFYEAGTFHVTVTVCVLLETGDLFISVCSRDGDAPVTNLKGIGPNERRDHLGHYAGSYLSAYYKNVR
jgi:hypothetical protein